MINNKKVLVNILARAGSTGVPDKNIADVGGRPVLWYSVSEAIKSKYADAVCVSTDSPKYALISEKAGVEVPFLRDDKYSTKESTAGDASRWTTLKYEEYSNEKYDYIVDFMNSNPFKLVEDLDRCIEILDKNECDTVVAVTRVWDGHPDRIKQIVDGEIQDWPGTNEVLESLRQDLTPPAYIRCGSVYAMKRHVLIDERNRRGKISLPYIMPAERVCNIDEPQDLLTAKAMMDMRNEGRLVSTDKSSYKVLCMSKCDDLPDIKKRISSFGYVDCNLDIKQDELKEIIHDYDILIVPTHLEFDKSIWKNDSNIKVIGSPSVGSEHIDKEFFDSKVKIYTLHGESESTKKIYSPAEIAFTHMINLSRNFVSAVNDVRDDNWNPNEHIGNELNGKIVGIIGMGSVGTIMSNYCKAFGMKVYCYDPHKVISDSDVKQFDNLNELIPLCDVISVHVELNDDTHNLFNEPRFKMMKSEVIFINTSRGEVVDSRDLLTALELGDISSAGIDVVYDERNKGTLYKRVIEYTKQNENLLVTPHLGGSTIEARKKRLNHICDKISEWINEN